MSSETVIEQDVPLDVAHWENSQSQKIAKDTDQDQEELFDEMINNHIGGWDFVYKQAQLCLDRGSSLGEQEREVKMIAQLFKRYFV